MNHKTTLMNNIGKIWKSCLLVSLKLMLFNARVLTSTNKLMIYKEITKKDYYVLILYLLILFNSFLRLLDKHFLSLAVLLLTASKSSIVSFSFVSHLPATCAHASKINPLYVTLVLKFYLLSDVAKLLRSSKKQSETISSIHM